MALTESQKERRREYYRKNREKILEQRKQYYQENRGEILAKNATWREENREQHNAACKKWRDENPGRWKRIDRKRYLKREYGITPERYDELFACQGGKGAICGAQSPRKKLAVDHCHETGKVRGLLCGSCNTGLGKLGDNIEGLRKALQYLEGVE